MSIDIIFVFENVTWHFGFEVEHQNEIYQTNTLATSTYTVEMVLRGRGIIHMLSFCTIDGQLCGGNLKYNILAHAMLLPK